MSATDELRLLLDERGVEWRERVWGGKHSVTTFWHARGVRWHYRENRFGEVRLHADGLTPEQAIEATLGRGECEQEEHGWSTEGDHARVWLTCGHDCMVETVADLPNYCPSCGRKVDA